MPTPSFKTPKEALHGVCHAIKELTEGEANWKRSPEKLTNEKNEVTYANGQLVLKNAAVLILNGQPTLLFGKREVVPLGQKAGEYVESYLSYMEQVNAAIPKHSSATYKKPTYTGMDID